MGSIRKPANMKYTDLAIYIDAHLDDIVKENSHPEIEKNVFEYIYNIVYALAYKQGFFTNMSYYDDFALYSACELYMSMRKKQTKAGSIIKGRQIIPIKSSLNYIKSVLFPLKINFQRQNFTTVLNPEIDQDTSTLSMNLKDSIQQQYSKSAEEYYVEAVKEFPYLIRKIVDQSPFRDHKLICKKLYMSIILTLLNQITLPTKLKNKLEKKEEWDKKVVKKYVNAFRTNIEDAILWHLDDSWNNYVQILVVKVKKAFSKKVECYIHSDDLSEEELDNILKSAFGNSVLNGIDDGD